MSLALFHDPARAYPVPPTNEPPSQGANEVLLMHATKPEHLYSILFEGLDPHLCTMDRFGSGTYFAEHAGKADQYAAKDPEWRGNRPTDPLYPLHSKLYAYGNKHQKDVCYALVCKVALGSDVALTVDGHERSDTGEGLWAASVEGVSKLAGRGHALLASPPHQYREFVVFERGEHPWD